jgi:competence protein ComEC
VRRLPPVGVAALAYAAGVLASRFGAVLPGAPLFLPLLVLAPIRAWLRPGRRWLWALLALAGFLSATADPGKRCAAFIAAKPGTLVGRFLAAPSGGATPFRLEAEACDLRVVAPKHAAGAGRRVRIVGEWREGRVGRWFLAAEVEEQAEVGRDSSPVQAVAWRAVRWRAALVERLHAQYGERGPLVAALILARKEGLDPELRDAFARSGIAHLLAISGFHVGVIAALLLALFRAVGFDRRQAPPLATVGTWVYVALIGFPDAASRAALIMALMVLARVRGRPAARTGPLAAAFLVLVVLDPGRLWGVGFQLSFAGALGLAVVARPIAVWLRPVSRGRLPEGVVTAVAAGVSATMATLPVVAWHFERISIVGVPATLVAAPLVALAVPGALVGLALDFVAPTLGSGLAGGVDVLLAILEHGARALGSAGWTHVWVTRGGVRLVSVGLAAGLWLSRRPRVHPRVRRLVTGGIVVAALLGWPLVLAVQGRGTLEIVVVDVGQGDAIAIRTPASRWILVDAGRSDRDGDAAAHPVVRALRRLGVRELEALILTHPDGDHIGGASAVLSNFRVGQIVDPGRVSGKESYVELLETAERDSIPWRTLSRGDRFEMDGVTFATLAPGPGDIDGDANDASVVLLVRFGRFDALLTGDSPTSVEREFAPLLHGGLEVLKVGHHGSRTSTGPALLDAARPELALISVGRRNRYGHPAPVVLRRLRAAGIPIHRTDIEGTLTILARADGRFDLTADRSGR